MLGKTFAGMFQLIKPVYPVPKSTSGFNDLNEVARFIKN